MSHQMMMCDDAPKTVRETTKPSVVDRLRLMRELCRVVTDCEKLSQPRHHEMAQAYLGELAAEIERALRQARKAA